MRTFVFFVTLMESFRSFVTQFLNSLADGESDTLADPSPSDSGYTASQGELLTYLKKIQQIADYEEVDVDVVAVEILAIGLVQHQRYKRAMRRWHKLTPKEREVTAFLCLGLSNEGIGEQLTIATGTVKAHVHHVLRKFEVQNRSQLQDLLVWWDAAAWLES